jgi:transposase
MQKRYFIGIDVSKHTLDVAFIIREQSFFSKVTWKQFSNTATGLRQLHQWLTEMQVPLSNQAIVVIENTGIYHRLLWHFFSSLQVDLCIENAAQVKWSLGIARGKNDKVDSRRLALYAVRHADRLKPTPALHQQVLPLKDLLTLRNKLLVQIRSITTNIKELKNISVTESFANASKKLLQPALNGLQQSLKQVEKEIKETLNKDKDLQNIYKRLITVPGIGPVTAMYLICCSNVFTMCKSGKQLACYCGVVPFDHQSGISIKGGQHVHKMANKELKRLLHMCALTSIKNHAEFKEYYNRKKREGKHAMSILNAIKNKLVLRAFAVVKNERDYVNNHAKAA